MKENELRQLYSEEDNLQVQHFCAKEKTEKVDDAYTILHSFHNPCRNEFADSLFLGQGHFSPGAG